MERPARLFRGYVLDLDGTVYLGDALLPTAGETITHLRKIGCRTVFLSNNPTHPPEDYAAKLTRLGLPTDVEDVLVSTQVLVRFLQPRPPEGRSGSSRPSDWAVADPPRLRRARAVRCAARPPIVVGRPERIGDDV